MSSKALLVFLWVVVTSTFATHHHGIAVRSGQGSPPRPGCVWVCRSTTGPSTGTTPTSSGGSTASPAPSTTPEGTTAGTPEPSPQPTTAGSPEPTPEPTPSTAGTPEPSPEPTPTGTPEPSTNPTSEVSTEGTPEPSTGAPTTAEPTQGTTQTNYPECPRVCKLPGSGEVKHIWGEDRAYHHRSHHAVHAKKLMHRSQEHHKGAAKKVHGDHGVKN